MVSGYGSFLRASADSGTLGAGLQGGFLLWFPTAAVDNFALRSTRAIISHQALTSYIESNCQRLTSCMGIEGCIERGYTLSLPNACMPLVGPPRIYEACGTLPG